MTLRLSLGIFLALLVAAAAAELWARLEYGEGLPVPVRPDAVALPPVLVEPDAELGQRFRADATTLISSAHGEFDALYQINDINLRGYGLGVPGERPPYVVVLGDAFTEGWGVMREDTFVKTIERRLRKTEGMNWRTRLFNAGMTGYGAAQASLLGRRLIGDLDPDVIVFVYSSLMPVADHRQLPRTEHDGDGRALKVRPPRVLPELSSAPAEQRGGLRAHSHFARVMNVLLEARAERAAVVPGDPDRDRFAATRATPEIGRELHLRSLGHVRALASLARARGIPFIFVHLPLGHQVADDEWAEGRAANAFETGVYPPPELGLVEAFCAGQDVTCVLTLPLLREAAARNASPIYFRYDYTLNVIGHRALVGPLTDVIATALRSRAAVSVSD